VTTYAESELQQIQYCQINDWMYLVHPNHPPAKLTRVADDNWTFAEIPFKWPPTLDENSANITVTPSATSGNITLTASAGIFSADQVGSTWQVGHNMAGKPRRGPRSSLGSRAPIVRRSGFVVPGRSPLMALGPER
jgi:hypothetical protein